MRQDFPVNVYKGAHGFNAETPVAPVLGFGETPEAAVEMLRQEAVRLYEELCAKPRPEDAWQRVFADLGAYVTEPDRA